LFPYLELYLLNPFCQSLKVEEGEALTVLLYAIPQKHYFILT